MKRFLQSGWNNLFQSSKGALRLIIVASLITPHGFAIVDVNENGMSDFWEKQYNAAQLFDASFDPQGDEDGDGWSNVKEALSGTDPLDGTPPAGFLTPQMTYEPSVWVDTDNDGIVDSQTVETAEVTWPSLIGKQYQLYGSPDLLLGSWLEVDGPRMGTGGIIGLGIPLRQPDGSIPERLFWRVAVRDVDTDGDGLTDHEENQSGSNPSTADTDGDNLTDLEEAKIGTDSNIPDTDDDELGDAEDAVPLDAEINWPKTPENRYVWIEQPTGEHTPKAVNSRGQILFEFSRPHPPLYETYPETTLENALWDSASQAWIPLATSGQAASGKVIKLAGLSDQGYVFGLSHAFSDFHPNSPAVNVAGMIWKPSASSPGAYSPPAYFMPAASWGQNNLVPGVDLIGGVSDGGFVNCVSGLGNATWAWETYNGSTSSQNTTSLSALGYEEKSPGATLDGTRSLMLLKDYQPGSPWRLNLHDGGQATEITGLLPASNSNIGTPGSDINIAPSLKDNGQQRLWLAANYYAEGAYHYPVRLEKRAGTGAARWYQPTSMAEGVWKLNARGEAVTAAKYDAQAQTVIPSKIWRNGKYTDLNELTSKPSGVEITHAIDLASNGIILAQATENGVTKTGLLLPVEIQVRNSTDDGWVAANELKVAKWEEAWSSTNQFRNDFIDSSPAEIDRFRIWIQGPLPENLRSVFISTTGSDDQTYNDNTTEVVLVEDPGIPALAIPSAGFFSKPIIVVADEIDNKFLNNNEVDDQTHIVALGSDVEFRIGTETGDPFVKLPVRKKATVNITSYVLTPNGAVDMELAERATDDIRVAREIYTQIGLEITGTVECKPIPSGVNLSDGLLLDTHETRGILSAEALAVLETYATPNNHTDLICIYVDAEIFTDLTSTGKCVGMAFPEGWSNANNFKGSYFVSFDGNPLICSHELGHILLNSQGGNTNNHYNVAGNLMRQSVVLLDPPTNWSHKEDTKRLNNEQQNYIYESEFISPIEQ